MADTPQKTVKNAKVRVLALSYINNQLLEAGAEIEGYTGEIGSNLEEIVTKRAAKAAAADDGATPPDDSAGA